MKTLIAAIVLAATTAFAGEPAPAAAEAKAPAAEVKADSKEAPAAEVKAEAPAAVPEKPVKKSKKASAAKTETAAETK